MKESPANYAVLSYPAGACPGRKANGIICTEIREV